MLLAGSLCSFQSLFLPPRLCEMADAGDGMHKEHPRSAIAHHFFDALAHLGLVAMHLAVGTKSLQNVFVSIKGHLSLRILA